MNIKDKTTKQLLNIDIQDFENLSRAELAQAVQKLGKTVNRRVKNLESKKMKTKASRALSRSGGKITTKGKSKSQLKKEFIRAQSFLKARSSTVSGAKKIRSNVKKTLSTHGVNATDRELDRAMNIVDKLMERNPNIKYPLEVLEQVIDEMRGDGGTMNDIINRLEEQWELEYENEQRDRTDFSNAFDWDFDI